MFRGLSKVKIGLAAPADEVITATHYMGRAQKLVGKGSEILPLEFKRFVYIEGNFDPLSFRILHMDYLANGGFEIHKGDRVLEKRTPAY